MNNTDINYREFIEYVHQKFEQEISLEKVEDILRLEEDYNKDSPTSIGKSLRLNRLIFSGTKVSGEEFRYDQTLKTGINVWIADNLKGKSTLFKIIKFALTGTDSIKADIKPWIVEIILEFQVGKTTYTCHIDRTGRDKGALFSFGIDKFLELKNNQKLELVEKEKEFEFRSKKQFEEKIQEFFFEHFSFYTLKYTQKKSSKEDLGLSTSNLSWSTYFKSIYLESSNYAYLFFDEEKYGAQGRKIFEMILGLHLTYPINMLGVQRDRVSEDIGKLGLTDKTHSENKKLRREELEKEYAEVAKALEEIKNSGKITFDEKPLIEEYNKTQEKVNENRKKARVTNDKYQAEKNKMAPLEEEIGNLEHDERKIKDEINWLTKQELNVELYIEAESFFSNLDIKVCPHCEVEVSEDKKGNERKNHVCSLCGETPTQQKIEEAELQAKIVRIKEEKDGHTAKLQELQKSIAFQKGTAEKLKKSVSDLYQQLIALPSVEVDNKRLKEVEVKIEAINKEREKHKELIEKKEELIKEEAVLKFQLQEIEKKKSADSSKEIAKLTLKRDILNYALSFLERKRIHLNLN